MNIIRAIITLLVGVSHSPIIGTTFCWTHLFLRLFLCCPMPTKQGNETNKMKLNFKSEKKPVCIYLIPMALCIYNPSLSTTFQYSDSILPVDHPHPSMQCHVIVWIDPCWNHARAILFHGLSFVTVQHTGWTSWEYLMAVKQCQWEHMVLSALVNSSLWMHMLPWWETACTTWFESLPSQPLSPPWFS